MRHLRWFLPGLLIVTAFLAAVSVIGDHAYGSQLNRFHIDDKTLSFLLLEELVIYVFAERWTIVKPIEMRLEPIELRIEDIGKRIHEAEAVYCGTLAETYAAITAAIYEVSKGPEEKRKILLAAMHGFTETREQEPRGFEPAIEDFDRALHRAATKDRFRIYELFNMTDSNRLERIVE